jgi:hypothetical protein
MKLTSLILACVLAASAQASFAAPISVAANSGYNWQTPGSQPTLTDLGSFAAGTYSIMASGTVELVPENTFTMNPDGTPTTPVTAGNYGSYFNPSGSFIADGHYGFAGTAGKIGALVGTLSATPGANDWFLIGYSKQLTLGSAGHIYAAVNETYAVNDSGAFSVTVTAVPEPESYALFLAGLGLMGLVARRRVA